MASRSNVVIVRGGRADLTPMIEWEPLEVNRKIAPHQHFGSSGARGRRVGRAGRVDAVALGG